MSRALPHLRHVKRGTPHVHACPLCPRWRVNPAVCTDPECDIVGVHIDCPSITPGQRYPLGGHYAACALCSAEADSADALAAAIAALHAFGDAIAYALTARDALRALGIADEDHERVATAHFALTELAGLWR